MNGLRIYVNRTVMEVTGRNQVFYSRRSMGPYYRWFYEETLNEWHVARVHSNDFSSKELSSSTWKTIPSLLQVTLKMHYDE